MSVFQIKSVEGDDKTKMVHQNLLPPLFFKPPDHTNTSDMESVVDQTVNTHGVVAVSAVTSHMQKMSAYSRPQVASLFQQG